MSTQVRFRRGDTAVHSTFVGASGEITVNTETNSIHVHDGVTPGGHPTLTTSVVNIFTAAQTVAPRSMSSAIDMWTQVDAALSNNWRILVQAHVYMGVPANMVDGQVLNFVFDVPTGPTYPIEFEPIFDFGTQPAPELDAGPSIHFMSCYYDQPSGKLISTWRRGAAGAALVG